MAVSVGDLLVNIKSDTTQLISGFNRAEAAVNKTTKQMTYAVKGLIGAFVGLNTLDIAKNFTKQLDLITSANNKLKLVTKTTEEFTNAQKRLFEVAQITSSGYNETVTLYSKLSDSMLKMGKSQSDVFRTVETVNKAIALSGSTAQEASAAILQLGQAFGSGVLQGDELKSINENAQGLSKAIADGMGVAVGELKNLGSEGKITAQVLADALAKVSGSVDSNFSKMQKTIAQSSQNISNSIQKIIGDFDKMTGVSKSVASVFNDISKYLESINGEDIQAIADTAETIGKVALSAGALAVGVKSYNTAVQIATAYNALFAGSYGAVNSAIVLATASQVAFNKAMKLSALGIAVTAIYGLSESFIEAKKRSDNLSLSVEQLANNFDALELKARLVDVNKELKAMDENIKGYNDTQKMMYAGGYDLAYKEKVQLEKSIALIDKKNEALKNGSPTTTTTNKTPLTDEVKSIIAPIDAIAEKYGKLYQNLTESGKATAENMALITAKMNEEIDNLDKESVQKRKNAEKEKEKAVKDAQEKIKDLTKDATDLTISEVDKINAKYMEMYNVIKDTFTPEQLVKFNTSWQESIDKANGTLDAQKEKQDLVNQALESSTSEYDKIIAKYLEMYNAIKDNPLWDSEKQNEFFANLNKELDGLQKKLDFSGTIELDTIGDDKSIQRIEKSFEDLGKATKKYEENRKDIAKGSADEAKNEEMFRKDQMNGYINMAGALGSMYQQGSKEAATFQAAQQSLALVEGTRAILTSGTGDPYTAIPRMAAMGIMVKSLLGDIGVALGMPKVSESTSSDSMSSLKANTGMGTVLGDSTRQSESIAKAMGILEDFAEPQFEVLESMNSYLETIANSIGGVSRLLIQSGQYGKAFGAGFTPTSTDTGWKGMGVTTNNLGSKAIGSTEKLFTSVLGDSLGGTTGKLFTLPTAIANKALSSAIDGIFGKSSTTVSTKLTDSGIYFADQLLTNARDEIYGSMYQTVEKKTTTTKKSWFGSSTSTKKKNYTNFYDMEGNTELERQFSLILDSMYNSTFEASKALDFTAEEITNTLDNFVVSIGKVSLNGLNGDQIQERLTSIFGAIGDNLAKTAFPLLVGFQQVGEGMYTTMTRVATGMEEARFYTDRLGYSTITYTDIINKQGVVGFEALAQSIIKADEATYGLNNGVVQMIGNMSATTEELYSTYLTFGNIRDILEATNQSASNLSSSMILGAGSISALESGTKSYMENFLSDSERLNIQLENLSEDFKNAGYTMPKTRQGFIDLIKSIDTSTEEGAKAYGRLIGLSDSYNETISEIEDNLSKLINTFSSLGDSVSQTIATLAGANTDSQSATQQIKSFWEKRKEIDNLLALNGNLTESQQSRLSTLVGEVNSLATNIQGLDTSSSSITSELITNLTSLESALNLEEQILSVNIVGVAPNVALIENIAGISATVPTLTNNTSNYVTSDNLSTDIKDILTTIKNNLSTYPQRTYDILDDVINGSQRVKVQTN